ncbi:MAG: hypothetical protein IJ364_08795 [Oscillospiraceae bacterium]|nr:hypothetical protein [Oscillospiraceae bacterium]
MREKWQRFMIGRNGHDQLNMFLLMVGIVLFAIASIFSRSFGRFVQPLVWLCLILIYFRMMSKNLQRRREENGKFIRTKFKVSGAMRARHERWIQRKDYKFFTCPSCKTVLRVPIGHVKIKVVCRKCGSSFIGKS